MYKARFLWSPKAVAMSIANSVDLDCLAVFSSESREFLLSISLFNIYLFGFHLGQLVKFYANGKWKVLKVKIEFSTEIIANTT